MNDYECGVPNEDIDYSDMPELDDEFWENAEIRTPHKKGIYIKLDQDTDRKSMRLSIEKHSNAPNAFVH